jgi:DNA replication protein DnaC
MLLEETIDKLLQLKLKVMCEAVRELLSMPAAAEMSFEDKLGLIVDREWIDRQNRQLAARLKLAKLGTNACMEDVICSPARNLDKATVRALSTCQWVTAKQNVVVVGATGTGKSYLAAALAQAACRRGFRALRKRVPRLLQELSVARADGSYVSALHKLAQVHVLVLDDLLISPMTESERRDLLEILEDRYDKNSTVITSQLPTKTWHEALGDPTLADAICDRVVHNAHRLLLKGPSIRKTKGMGTEQPDAINNQD